MKRLIRRLVPAELWLSLSCWRKHFGVLTALRMHAPLLFSRERLLRVAVEVAGRRTEVYLRPGTTDFDVFREVFVSREYHLDVGQPRRILDAGAHIGLASVVFAARFPQASIIALEPEPSNFAMLKRNTAPFPNVTAVQAGLWSQTAKLRIVDTQATTWGFRVEETQDGTGIPALGLEEVIARLGDQGPLMLKIDIEGSEVEVLADSARWIGGVETIMIELHDRFRPGCTQALENAIQARPFQRSMSGESVVLRAPALSAA